MRCFFQGRYRARLAEDDTDLRAAQRLRWLAFVGRRAGIAPAPGDRDADDHDAICQHVLIEDARSDALVACFRILPLADGSQIGRSYAAQFYDLSALSRFGAPLVELGRFCVHPDRRDPDILRLAWAVLARCVDDTGAQMLFGCSSFAGAAPEPHAQALAMLHERHLAPTRWLPRIKAPHVVRMARLLDRRRADPRRAMAAMPPLLRSYLLMGGWVSDHAVVDRQLDTLHVFTGLEIGRIPPGRARLMRGAAGLAPA